MRRIKFIELFVASVFIYMAVSMLIGLFHVAGSDRLSTALTLFMATWFVAVFLVIDMFFGSYLFSRLIVYIGNVIYGLRIRYMLAPYEILGFRVNNPLALLVALVFLVNLVGGVLVWRVNALLSILLILWGLSFIGYFVYRAFFVPSLYSVSLGRSIAMKVSRRVPWFVLLSRMGFLSRLSRPLSSLFLGKIYSYSLKAGCDYVESELKLIVESIVNLSIIVALAVSPLLFSIVGVYGIVVLSLPLLSLIGILGFFFIRAFDRAKSIEEELPFLVLAGLLTSLSGLGLSHAFKELSSADFPAIRNENRVLERLSRRMDPVEALNQLGKDHPSRLFREFLLGYVSVLLSGGDIVRYLEDRVREFFSMQGSLFRRYVSYVSDLLSASVFVFLFGPLLVLLIAFVSPERSVVLVLQLNMFIIPLILAVMYIVIHSLQPRFRDLYSDLYGIAIAGVSGGLAAIASSLTGAPGYLVIGLTLLSMSVGYGVWFSFNHKRILVEERSLARFIRDVIELRKVGYSVDRCIRELVSRGEYDPLFTEVLRDYIDGRYTARSWITRVVLRILSIAEESGSDLPVHLEIINRYISDYMVYRFEVRSELRPKVVLVYLVPFILSFIVYMVYSLVTRYASMVSVPGFLLSFNLPEELIDYARTTVILVSASLSLLVSKAVDGTIRNMIRTSLAIVLSMLALQTMEPLIVSFLGNA